MPLSPRFPALASVWPSAWWSISKTSSRIWLPLRTWSRPGPSTDDVLSALVNLGYQRALAQKAIAAAVAKDKTVGESFEALFRAALAGMRN